MSRMSEYYGFVVFWCVVLVYFIPAAALEYTEQDTAESSPSEDRNYWNITSPTTDSDDIEITTYQDYDEDTELLAYLINDTDDKDIEHYKSNIFSIPKKRYYHHKKSENIVDSNIINRTTITGKWVTNVLGELLWEFAPTSENNAECSVQSEVYKQKLKNVTLWAVQSKYMFYFLFTEKKCHANSYECYLP